MGKKWENSHQAGLVGFCLDHLTRGDGEKSRAFKMGDENQLRARHSFNRGSKLERGGAGAIFLGGL